MHEHLLFLLYFVAVKEIQSPAENVYTTFSVLQSRLFYLIFFVVVFTYMFKRKASMSCGRGRKFKVISTKIFCFLRQY